MKKLLVNPVRPSKDNAGQLILVEEPLLEFVTKVLGKIDDFKPRVIKDHHIRLFVANIDPKVVAVQSYTGETVSNYGEAMNFFNKVGTSIYGKDWLLKLFKTRIEDSKQQTLITKARTQSDFDALVKALKEVKDLKIELLTPFKTKETKEITETTNLKEKVK